MVAARRRNIKYVADDEHNGIARIKDETKKAKQGSLDPAALVRSLYYIEPDKISCDPCGGGAQDPQYTAKVANAVSEAIEQNLIKKQPVPERHPVGSLCNTKTLRRS